MNPIQFVNQKILPWNRWVDLCNRQRRPYSLFITLLSSIWIVVGTHSAKMITEENECIYLMSTVIRERKTSHLFIVLIVFPPYELINLRQLAFEIIFSLYEFLKPGPLEIVLLNPSNARRFFPFLVLQSWSHWSRMEVSTKSHVDTTHHV